MLTSKKKNSAVVGLDIETGSVAATEVVVNGSASIGRTGIAPLPAGATREGEVADSSALADALKDLFAEHELPKQVRVGVANQRVMVRTWRVPFIENKDELDAAIRFQAHDQIPMPLEQAVLDWQVVGYTNEADGSRQMEVVVVAARREMVDGLVDAVRSAGLRPVGIDVSAFGMIRALAASNRADAETAVMAGPEAETTEMGAGTEEYAAPAMAKLFCSLGDVTNLAVARDTTCLFSRVSFYGMEGIAQRLSERRGLTLEHSRQWLTYVGLDAPLDSIEGDPEIVAETRRTLEEGSSKLADELRLSLDFYGAQERALAIDEIVACGPGTLIPGLAERLQRDLGRVVRIARPAPLASLEDSQAARLTISYGLGLDE
jgi:type IV pilus assembly protein PilM